MPVETQYFASLRGEIFNPSIFFHPQHLYSCEGGLFALVAVTASGPVFSLLFVEGGQYAKDYGFSGDEVCLCDAIGYRLADIIEVWSFSLYDATQAYYGVDVFFLRHQKSA